MTNAYRKDFPLLMAQDIAYLDNAATAQRPQCVLDAVNRFYCEQNANPLRGLYPLSVAATDAYENARAAVRRFLNAGSTSEIVFTRNTTEGLNLAAYSYGLSHIRAGDEVVVSILEHHSDLLPWQMVCRQTGAALKFLECEPDGSLDLNRAEAVITDKTKLVAVTHVSNVIGRVTPIRQLADIAHRHGAVIVVDGAQSTPHIPVDVQALDADFLAFSGHKVYGPMGIGVLWGKMDLLNAMPPMLTGGEMIDSVTEQDAVWAPVPEKFEAGTQDAAGIFATGAALDYLVNTVGYENIQAREQALVHYLMGELMQLDFVQIIGSIYWDNHHGVVSFNVKGIHPHDVASIMDMDGVCIRAGHHCAQPLLTWLGVENLACCRASVAFYNDKADIDKFIAGLHHVWSTFNG